ncbi:hypothetical protein [Pseudonocardia oroxyli]|uniref:Uncharacterized membrane protein n=1 Tax=Pseudonocardia oroxyli TaxID=366584 RepID=A0A1G7XQ70_PSEOR|nr:hypothetical protein [Pseudonocardia oroxyli]SDG86226.1 Uncharacterized membrane protein [Pseudonocardia oroxyli]
MSTSDPTAAADRLPHPARELLARLARAAALGAATGGRSSAGPAAVALSSTVADRGVASRLGTPAGRAVACLFALGEVVADKLPVTPPRTQVPGLAPRLLFAPVAAVAAGLRTTRDPDVWNLAEATAAVGAALATAFGGVRLRAVLAERLGTDLPGAFLEDAVVAGLAWSGAHRSTP